MMRERKYMPILKWKSGEKIALEKLSDKQKSFICPILEVFEYEDAATIVHDLTKFKDMPCYLDTSYVEEDISLLTSIIRESREKSIMIFPVLYYENFPSDANDISEFTDRLLVRVTVPEDIDGESYETIFKSVADWKKGKDLQVDVMLDLFFIEDKNSANLKLSELKNVLNDHIIKNESLSNIIIASTCFPDSLATLAAGENMVVDRYEMKIYKKIFEDPRYSVLKNRLIYADYGVTRFTDTELDFSRMKYGPLPKVRYTIPDKYWILKGKRNTETRQVIRNYVTIAREIIESKNYYGETFSFGDQEIKERALGINGKGPGNHTNWVTIAANHHIAVVVEELSTLLDI